MTPPAATRQRIASIDLLRGIVMVIMALDHVRDFFYNVPQRPLDLQTTTPLYFFTRWITHFCAPVFLFLAGLSAYFMGMRRSKAALCSFLIRRGAWLIFAELFIVSLGISFDPFYHIIFLQVIWATGIGMILLGLVIRLPFPWVLAIGLLIVGGHNLLDQEEIRRMGQVGFFWDLIHVGRFSRYFYAPGRGIIIVYSFLPWTGIMILGYCLGRLYEPAMQAARRRKILLYLGFGMILLFIFLRWINQYGDPVPWVPQNRAFYSFLSFINVNKYPPSLMYTLVMLGPALVFLALTETVKNRVAGFFTIYGRVPFFYYIIHFYLIHTLLVIAFFAHGYGRADIANPNMPFLFLPPGFAFNLGVVYGVWALVIVIMYPLCRRYDRYKSTHTQWWLKYL